MLSITLNLNNLPLPKDLTRHNMSEYLISTRADFPSEDVHVPTEVVGSANVIEAVWSFLTNLHFFSPNRSTRFKALFILAMLLIVMWKGLQVFQYTIERIQILRRKRKRLARSAWAKAVAKKSVDPPKTAPYQHRVAFLHPDLGIGGAERLIVDAVIGMQDLIPAEEYLQRVSTLKEGEPVKQPVDTVDEFGIINTPDPSVCASRPSSENTSASRNNKIVLPALFDVHVFTNHHDPKRCFEETIDGSFRNPVITLGAWIPRQIKNKGRVLFASLRMIYAALVLCFRYQMYVDKAFDCIVVDQAAAAMPILKMFAPSVPVFFYCHFPDQLCDPTRMPVVNAAEATAAGGAPTVTTVPHTNPIRRLYRGLFDALEGISMNCADRVVCNSSFTRSVTVAVFPNLDGVISKTRDILYPPINIPQLLGDGKSAVAEGAKCDNFLPLTEEVLVNSYLTNQSAPKFAAVSLNRFEQKKNVALAIGAFGAYVREVRSNKNFDANDYSLIIAGGYDPRLPENVSNFNQLLAQVKNAFGDCLRCATALYGDVPDEYKDDDKDKVEVLFLRSCTANTKKLLLSYASAVLYTPSGEHFGIVPVEAMAFRAPVVALSNGGPLESVGLGGKNGILCNGDVADFKKALVTLWGKASPKDSAAFTEKEGARKRLHLTAKGLEISSNGVQRASETFSLNAFAKKMGNAIDNICDGRKK